MEAGTAKRQGRILVNIQRTGRNGQLRRIVHVIDGDLNRPDCGLRVVSRRGAVCIATIVDSHDKLVVARGIAIEVRIGLVRHARCVRQRRVDGRYKRRNRDGGSTNRLISRLKRSSVEFARHEPIRNVGLHDQGPVHDRHGDRYPTVANRLQCVHVPHRVAGERYQFRRIFSAAQIDGQVQYWSVVDRNDGDGKRVAGLFGACLSAIRIVALVVGGNGEQHVAVHARGVAVSQAVPVQGAAVGQQAAGMGQHGVDLIGCARERDRGALVAGNGYAGLNKSRIDR